MKRSDTDTIWFGIGAFLGLIGMGLLIAFFILMTGCVKHEVRAPQIDEAISAIKKPCPTVILPPIRQDVVIDIKGDKVTANAGGEELLRGYVQARSVMGAR
jgi:hypothetical protein